MARRFRGLVGEVGRWAFRVSVRDYLIPYHMQVLGGFHAATTPLNLADTPVDNPLRAENDHPPPVPLWLGLLYPCKKKIFK